MPHSNSVSTQCELWEVPWTLLALCSFPRSKTNTEWKRSPRNKEKRGEERSGLSLSAGHDFHVLQLWPGDTAGSPNLADKGQDLVSSQSQSAKTPRPEVFTQKTGCEGWSIRVKIPQRLHGRNAAQFWTPRNTLNTLVCFHVNVSGSPWTMCVQHRRTERPLSGDSAENCHFSCKTWTHQLPDQIS